MSDMDIRIVNEKTIAQARAIAEIEGISTMPKLFEFLLEFYKGKIKEEIAETKKAPTER